MYMSAPFLSLRPLSSPRVGRSSQVLWSLIEPVTLPALWPPGV